MQNVISDTVHLNLARKWRSQNFDEIIGQDIPVRMLKNSLYIGQFFPVYLFSGQRGCGKTSTARIFAAAVNCEQLPSFKKNPQHITIPCAACTSCKAMLAGKHPDCIEIDAASHTGVDHVRQIIDASTLLPLLGNKKIYIVDEAHMLSKAAFNAFLKILEEPPASVVFIFATTDPEKIIETVKSRCFQVIFKPIKKDILVTHLENICKKENISYEHSALAIIAQESEGAARDALNVLEQVRFAHEKVTKEAVFDVLGHVGDEQLLQLFDCLLNKPLAEFALVYANVVTDTVSPTFLWQTCIALFRASLACLYTIPFVEFMDSEKSIKEITKHHSPALFIGLMRLFYEHEMMFLKTSTPHAFLQMLLFQASQYVHGEFQPLHVKKDSEVVIEKTNTSTMVKKKTIPLTNIDIKLQDPQHPDTAAWSSFLYKINMLDDPLVTSVFKQGYCAQFDLQSGELKVVFPKDFAMFEDMLLQAQKHWKPLLDEIFKRPVSLIITYQESKKTEVKKENTSKDHTKATMSSEPKEQQKQEFIQQPIKKLFTKKQQFEKVINVSNKDTWKKTNLVLEFFPGSVTELQGEEDVTS